MDEQEQMMMALWLAKLRSLLDEGDVATVKNELDQALGRIEEDQPSLASGQDSSG
jgi:hypothetical protein